MAHMLVSTLLNVGTVFVQEISKTVAKKAGQKLGTRIVDGKKQSPAGTTSKPTQAQIVHGTMTLGKSKYTGNMIVGIGPHGYGTLVFERGKIYKGDFVGGKIHGKGTLVEADGKMYEGEWRDDKKDGFGVLKWPNGSKYEGQWRNDKLDGAGKYTEANNKSTYNGEYRNGAQDGRGTYITKELRYDGWFKQSRFDGIGKLDVFDSHSYEGEFKTGLFEGKGCITFKKSETVVTGTFEKNFPKGIVKYEPKNGPAYEGEMKKYLKNGKGVLKYKNGDRYEGEFEANACHGKGIYYYANGNTFEGQWKKGVRMEGKFSGSDEPPPEISVSMSEDLSESLNLSLKGVSEKEEKEEEGIINDESVGVHLEHMKTLSEETRTVLLRLIAPLASAPFTGSILKSIVKYIKLESEVVDAEVSGEGDTLIIEDSEDDDQSTMITDSIQTLVEERLLEKSNFEKTSENFYFAPASVIHATVDYEMDMPQEVNSTNFISTLSDITFYNGLVEHIYNDVTATIEKLYEKGDYMGALSYFDVHCKLIEIVLDHLTSVVKSEMESDASFTLACMLCQIRCVLLLRIRPEVMRTWILAAMSSFLSVSTDQNSEENLKAAKSVIDSATELDSLAMKCLSFYCECLDFFDDDWIALTMKAVDLVSDVFVQAKCIANVGLLASLNSEVNVLTDEVVPKFEYLNLSSLSDLQQNIAKSDLLFLRSSVSLEYGQLKRASRELTESKMLLDSVQADIISVFHCKNRMVKLLYDIGRPTESKKEMEDCIRIAEETNATYFHVRAKINVQIQEAAMDRNAQSVIVGNDALNRARGWYPRLVASILVFLCSSAAYINVDAARGYLESAKEFKQKFSGFEILYGVAEINFVAIANPTGHDKKIMLASTKRLIEQIKEKGRGNTYLAKSITAHYAQLTPDIEEGKKIAQELYADAQMSGDVRRQSLILRRLSAFAVKEGDKDAALGFLNKALTITKDNLLPKSEMMTLDAISIIHYSNKNFEETVRCRKESVRIASDVLGSLTATYRTLRQLASGYWASLDYLNAIATYENALSIADKLDSMGYDRTEGRANILKHMGTIKKTVGENDNALDYLGQAMAIFQMQSSYILEVSCGLLIANIRVARGELDEAIALCKSMLMILKKVDDNKEESEENIDLLKNRMNLFAVLGRCCREKNSLSEGLQWYNHALTLSTQLDLKVSTTNYTNSITAIKALIEKEEKRQKEKERLAIAEEKEGKKKESEMKKKTVPVQKQAVPVKQVSKPFHKPVWIADKDAPMCDSCGKTFGILLRRHHCRACGKVFCDRCSPHSITLPPQFEFNSSVRVCLKCEKIYKK